MTTEDAGEPDNHRRRVVAPVARIAKLDSARVLMPSLTAMRMSVQQPTAVGVPLRADPCEVLKLAHAGLLAIVKRRLALSGSLAVGRNEYSRTDVHPARGLCPKSSAADWPRARARSCQRRVRQQRTRQLSHWNIWTLCVDARNFREQAHRAQLRAASTRVWQGKWSDGSPCTAQAGFTRTSARGAGRRGNPAIRARCCQRNRGPEALRHRLSTVLPLCRRRGSVPAPRDMTYRASPASNQRMDSGKEA